MCFLCTVYVRMQCSVLLYSLLYKYCCTAVWRPPPPQCSYCSRHRLSGRRSYLHPQFTAQLVGACSYWHLGTEHVFLWPCAYYYYFLRLKFLTTKFLTGVGACSYWHLGTEHVFLWPCAYYYYFLRLKFLTTKFLTGDAVCR